MPRLKECYAVYPHWLQRAPRAHIFLQETRTTPLPVGPEGWEGCCWVSGFLLSLSGGSQLLEDPKDWPIRKG